MLHAGESPPEAALREAAEEIGLRPENVEVLGTATPLYVPASDTGIVPVIAAFTQQEPLQANPAEVEEILLLSLDWLRQLERITATWHRNGHTVVVPLWHIHPRVPLWGATAMILSELLWLYEEFLSGEDATPSGGAP